ncbi:MAG: methyltetrahydrofolate--corrinoid methyltransferase [Candidatus Scalindua sp. AMX11]|nr:MAG: methyltetrahydrofolate--corrinoid methyltransferase [Candidatus Scalindua sp.]NOG85741.1 dihydropteroate synthase [Planctomycetota bacterium]RZV73188.1 MAG: methyltetrahydrofolate--corrinoid methyltransferase [Candidatus Scalindua sp. SCAELEC01]TDE64722.1 MAG: methyltetrahydrofolate--corrinoid methyltransferase [Candidatus Scalindua sp. AMX11]GJQ58715.1 MAG: 5-methyltetrahydrofolate:corrinoid/iron-sulfur protein Co-methyltransferase [Candidatus Scalindua sp.]
MISIGERINGMFTDVKNAIKNKDATVVQELAKQQTEAGATYLDINVGTEAADQLDAMKWLVEVTQEAVKTPIAIDSQKLDVIKAGLEVVKNEVMINSAQGDPETLDTYMQLAKQHNAALICLTMNKEGIPQDVDNRVAIAMTIVEKATEHGMDMDKIFIDPILLTVNVDQKQPAYMLEVFSQIKLLSDPPPHITVGLSNFSQGTKEKSLLNRTFLTMAIAAGMDTALMDVLDTDLMDAAICSEMILNKQIYSDSFLKAARQ